MIRNLLIIRGKTGCRCNMTANKTFLIVFILVSCIWITGCTSPQQQAPPVTPTLVQTTLVTVIPTTPEPTSLPLSTTIATTTTTPIPSGREVLHEKGMLTTESFKTYDFKTQMGYKFLYPKDKFRVTIKAEKPVLGYAVSSAQASQLQGSQLVPRYQTYKDGVDWGLIEPHMILEKATDSTKEFSLEDVESLTYVVDGRWMSFENSYANTPPFSYEITIVKTGGPTQQNFDF